MSPAETLVIFLAYRCQFVYWALASYFSRRLPEPAGKRISRGFLLLAIASLLLFLPLYKISDWFPVLITGSIYFVAALTLVVGTRSASRAGYAANNVGSRTMRYYATDELIARVATHSTANDKLDEIKSKWVEALNAVVALDPEHTVLLGDTRFNRVLALERYVEMESYERSPCGQIRSVHLHFAGPGDALPWMSISAVYSIDQETIGRFELDNVEVLQHADDPTRLLELERIRGFLRTGRVQRPLSEWIEKKLVPALLSVAAAPINCALFVGGMAFAPIKGWIERHRRQSRFVPTRYPEMLPADGSHILVGYWNALLPDLAGEQQAVLKEINDLLAARAPFGIKTYPQDVVQWGGYRLKEVRQQTVIELRRTKVFLGVYAYGNDLYVRWDSHIHRRAWTFQKFPYTAALGYRFPKHFLSWAVPMFITVPDVFEYAPVDSAVTDYDWADVDAVQDLVHDIVSGVVRELAERHKIHKQINFEINRESRQEKPGAEPGADRSEKRKSRWRRALAGAA